MCFFLHFIGILTNPVLLEGQRIWLFFGRLHPIAVHFPVALVVIIFVMELAQVLGKISQNRASTLLVLWIYVASALFSVGFGLLLVKFDEFAEQLVFWHQWFGIGSALISVLLLWLYYRIPKNSNVLWIYRCTLLVQVILICITGHLGGNITHHGEDYLSIDFSKSDASNTGADEQDEASIDIELVSFKNTATLSREQEAELNIAVRTILAPKCYQCHNADKVKGELRPDSREWMLKGGKNGPAIRVGQSDKSELIRRVTLPAYHKEVMPSKGKRLSNDEVQIVKLWIDRGAPWPENIQDIKIFREAKLEPRNPELPGSTSFSNPIDTWVDVYFKKNNITWQDPVSDELYIKRVYLDLLGLVPGFAGIEEFKRDQRENKRELLVSRLLAQDTEYALHWLTFWNDALRNDYTRSGYIDGGRTKITDWIYKSLATNKPYDTFVKELLNPNAESEGFVNGIKWRGSINASQYTEMQAAQNVSQVLLGVNLKCASCHDSFVSNLKLKDAYAFANIFAEKSLEINKCDKPTGKFTGTRILFESLGTIDSSLEISKRLELLSKYMV